MTKLKPPWVKSDIPKTARIELWRLMKDNHTFDSFQGQVAKHYNEIFIGVSKTKDKYSTISRETYRELQYEIEHMPAEEVLHLPDDLQVWIRWLRPELLGEEQKERVLNVTPEYRDHWHRLGRIAEELKIGLEFPKYIEGVVAESRFGDTVWGNWSYSKVQFRDSKFVESPEIHFSAEERDLWDCLLKHMDAEFQAFSSELQQVCEVAVRILNKSSQETIREQPQLRSHPKVQELRQRLWTVIERGTFKGTCKICEDWG